MAVVTAIKLFFLTKFIEELSTGPDDDAALERLLLAGEMLAEIGRETLAESGTRLLSRLQMVRSQRRCGGELSTSCSMPTRGCRRLVRVSDYFASWGGWETQRFVVPGGRTVPILDRLGPLFLNEIAVGDDDEDRPPPKSLLVATSPVRRVQICELQAARYPTTNAEFAEFIEAGGVRRRSMVVDRGPSVVERRRGLCGYGLLGDHHDVDWKAHFGTELQTGKFRMEDVLRSAADMSRPRLEPFYWRNARYNESNQPVVGVNWWEAHAYCAWLTYAALRANGSIPESVRVRRS